MPCEIYPVLISTEIAVMCKSNPTHIMLFCMSTFHKHDSMTEERESCSRLMVYLNAIK